MGLFPSAAWMLTAQNSLQWNRLYHFFVLPYVKSTSSFCGDVSLNKMVFMRCQECTIIVHMQDLGSTSGSLISCKCKNIRCMKCKRRAHHPVNKVGEGDDRIAVIEWLVGTLPLRWRIICDFVPGFSLCRPMRINVSPEADVSQWFISFYLVLNFVCVISIWHCWYRSFTCFT